MKVTGLLLAAVFGSALPSSAALVASFSQNQSAYSQTKVRAADWADDTPEPVALDSAAGSGIIRSTLEANSNYIGWGTSQDLTKYVGFGVSADPGHQLTLTDFVFQTGATFNWYGAGYIVTSYTWAYRVDADKDGTYEQGWTFGKTYTSADADFATKGNKTWDFQDFTTAGNVEFGLFATGDTAEARLEILGQLALNGSVSAVPEASTALLGVLGALALLRRRR